MVSNVFKNYTLKNTNVELDVINIEMKIFILKIIRFTLTFNAITVS